MKTKHIVVKATEEFKEKAIAAAKSDEKTLSGYVTSLINADLKKRDLKK